MNIWGLNLRHLQAIVKIAELGRLNAAAKSVNLTQPAITQALSRLEERIGHPLFERQHGGMTQTPAAQVLVPRIEAALAHIASPHVTMARLRALTALADSGSYTAASVRTGLSVPAIHREIRDLTLSLRRNLVGKTGKRVFMTEAGNQLARAFRLAQVELQTGLSEVDALRGIETRRIAVGAMPLSRARVLPTTVTRFLHRYPQVKLSIIEGSRNELLEPLRNGTLDLMIGAMRDPLLEEDLFQTFLFKDHPIVVGRKNHPLAGKKPKPSELAKYPWVLAPPGTPLRSSWERFFQDAGLSLPPIPVESGSVIMIRQILIATDFLTLLSPYQFALELEANWLERIYKFTPRFARAIGMTTRASWRPTEVQRDFVADLRTTARAAD